MRRLPALLVSLLAGLFTIPASVGAQDIPESSPAAIEAHAKGLRLYLAQQYQDALPHFYEAHELDPTFFTPLFVAGLSAGNAGLSGVRDSLWTIVRANEHRLSGYYRGLLAAYAARAEGDVPSSDELMRKVATSYPGTKASYNHAMWTQAVDPRGALRSLATLDPEREPMRGWFAYWAVTANARHALREHEAELTAVRRAAAQYPTSIAPLAHQLRALAALGQIEELRQVVARAEGMEADRGWHRGNVMIEAGVELTAHGHAAEGRRHFDRALAIYDALPSDQAGRTAMRAQRAFLLYNLGRYGEARTAYEALARDFPNNVAWQGWVAVTAALTGDNATAEATAAKFASGELETNQVNRTSWRASIAAALGRSDEAMNHLGTLPAGALWIHRDPTLHARLGKDSRFTAFLGSVK
jgi:tetratricopeptide (TPR) repeat protein